MEFRAGVVTPTSTWRALILYGANAATYKFAFATALLEAAATTDKVSLQDLAPRYSTLLCKALRREPRQGTAGRSRFLQALRDHNAGELDWDGARAATTRLGFNDVVDAFPVLDGGPAPVTFYEDRRRDPGVRGLVLTEDLRRLADAASGQLGDEVDARWRLVETAWAAGINPGLTGHVGYDRQTATLVVGAKQRRRSVTGVVAALSGYQDGRCAYCDELMDERGAGTPVVDHVLPFTLLQPTLALQQWQGPDLDSVWNLVLACQHCNSQKSARLPTAAWMPWLSRRNEALIDSAHPLRQTLVAQTGADQASRWAVIQEAYESAFALRQTRWTPPRQS